MGRNGTLARGQIPWSDEEKTWALAHLDEFRSSFGINGNALADALNSKFHEGKPIRTQHVTNSIRGFLKNNTSESLSDPQSPGSPTV